MKTKGVLTIILSILIVQSQAQGLILQSKQDKQTASNITLGCGSYDLMQHLDDVKPGFLDLSNRLMQDIKKNISNQGNTRSLDSIHVIPVVFHIVYNNNSENIPDSVVQNQIEVLNHSFRRTNSDTTNTRAIFQNVVGDTKIEFILAETDPEGNPTTGITRTQSDIEYFGGILPYGQGQNQEITDWVNDSLLYNLFRLTNDTLGGKNSWDTDKYLNVWIGDLRIFEPEFNNYKELVYFGLSTPPIDHYNWPDSVLNNVNTYEQGILLHYVNLGANNPNNFPSPYHAYNGLVTSGKMLVHEIGHFLGLRHIWGDGDCSFDDFIYDTPNSSAASQWNCDKTRNTCVDDIYGIDPPDMVENYMDYSSGNCQNSFTLGQAALMLNVLDYYRPELSNLVVIDDVKNNQIRKSFIVYPNPTTGAVTIKSEYDIGNFQIIVYDNHGRSVKNTYSLDNNTINFTIEGSKGIYFMEIISNNRRSTFKVLKL
ncbi:MAG: zinc-dependent metalloprotease [Bacteroidales bacterium]|nr:zinc-dependent metalloprotease [Bacteroidales bacterium]